MAKFRVRIELNKGRHGVPIHRLAKVAEEAEKFFQMFAADLGLTKGDWIADNFTDGSVGFDTNYVGAAPDTIILTSQKAFKQLTDPQTSPDDLKYGVSKGTFLQFAKMAFPVDADDFVNLGVYNGQSEQPEMRELTKQRALEIEKEIVQTAVQYGGVQGIITALFKESNTFWIRELSTGKKLSCLFPNNLYNLVWNALKDKDAVVNVEGWKTIIGGKVEHLKATNITPAAEYLEDDLERFFGCDPNFTGNQSTEQFIDDLRGETTEDYLKHLTDEDE
jgi:hypothetical protein